MLRTISVESLLKHNASVNLACVDKLNKRFETSLHVAARYNCIDVIKILKKYDANMNVIDNKKRTPLHCAVAKSHFEVIKLLLEYGADPDCKDSRGQRPIDLTTDENLKTLISTFKTSKQILSNPSTRNFTSTFFEKPKNQPVPNLETIAPELSWKCNIL